jgi:hypothetical protein
MVQVICAYKHVVVLWNGPLIEVGKSGSIGELALFSGSAAHVIRAVGGRTLHKLAALAAPGYQLADRGLYKTEHKKLPLFSAPDRRNEEQLPILSDAFSDRRQT